MFHDLLVISKNMLFFKLKKIKKQELAGNYVILQGEEAYALLAHMRKDSVRVKSGDKIKSGDVIGEVGHSGNSTAPHLHFHLMDNADVLTANGIPCSFKEYELCHQDKWVKVKPSNTLCLGHVKNFQFFTVENRRFSNTENS